MNEGTNGREANGQEEPNHVTDFAAWKSELYGPEVVGTRSSADAFKRVVMVRDKNGKFTRDNTMPVAVDKYGLPVPALGAGPDEAMQLELRWDSALIEYPYRARALMDAGDMYYMIPRRWQSKLLHGEMRQDEDRHEYVQAWKDLGFTPEMYVMLHAMLPMATRHVLEWAEIRGCTEQLELRLQSLEIRRIVDDHWDAWHLHPEHWADLPRLMTYLRPLEAVKLIIKFSVEDPDADGDIWAW